MCREYNIPLYITLVDYTKAYRICVHQTPHGYLHQQLDDSPPTQRKQQDQHQEKIFKNHLYTDLLTYGIVCHSLW